MNVAERSPVESCPHCGKPFGSALRCSHCGRLLKKHRVRLVVLLIALVMSLALFLNFRSREPQLIGIADIKPIRNLSVVRVQGIVQENIRSLSRGGYHLVINDGSGFLPIFVGNTRSTDKKIWAGDCITVTGCLSINPELMVSLRVASLEDIEVCPLSYNFPQEAERIEQITAARVGESVSVCGIVGTVSQPAVQSRAPYKVRLRDLSGSITIVYWSEVAVPLRERSPRTGDLFQMSGVISLYRGALQITVTEASSIKKVSSARTQQMP